MGARILDRYRFAGHDGLFRLFERIVSRLELRPADYARLLLGIFGHADGGKGILHATMAVRHDWGGNSPLHLGMFFAVRLAAAFKAYHGEGDHAPDASQTQVQKAVYIVDASGRQRRGRQIMLPRAWEYEPNLPRIAGGMSGQSLLDEVARHRRQRLPFE